MLFSYGAVVAAAPTVVGTNSGTSAGNDRAPVTYDAAASSGQLLLVFISCQHAGGIAGIEPASGYTQLYDTTLGSGTFTAASFYKISTGGETGADFLTDTAAAGNHSWIAYRISGRQGNPEVATATGTIGASGADSPNLTPSWGSALNLWLTTGHTETSQPGTPTTPTNYTNAIFQAGDDGGGGTSGKVYSARRALSAASENPGAWGPASDSGAGYAASTVAVRPT